MKRWQERLVRETVVGVLGAVGGLLVGVIGSFEIQVSAALAFGFAFLGAGTAHLVSEVSHRIEEVVATDVERLAEHLPHPFLVAISKRAVRGHRNGLRALADNPPMNRSECLAEMITAVDELPKIDADQPEASFVRAVCGDKNWGFPAVQEYFNRQITRAKAGEIRIQRVFIERLGDFPEHELPILEAHVKAQSPNVGWSMIRAAGRVGEEFGMPEAFGFAIIGNRVFVHWGFATKDVLEGGIEIASPALKQVLRDQFALLWKSGTRDSSVVRRLRGPPGDQPPD